MKQNRDLYQYSRPISTNLVIIKKIEKKPTYKDSIFFNILLVGVKILKTIKMIF